MNGCYSCFLHAEDEVSCWNKWGSGWRRIIWSSRLPLSPSIIRYESHSHHFSTRVPGRSSRRSVGLWWQKPCSWKWNRLEKHLRSLYTEHHQRPLFSFSSSRHQIHHLVQCCDWWYPTWLYHSHFHCSTQHRIRQSRNAPANNARIQLKLYFQHKLTALCDNYVVCKPDIFRGNYRDAATPILTKCTCGCLGKLAIPTHPPLHLYHSMAISFHSEYIEILCIYVSPVLWLSTMLC